MSLYFGFGYTSFVDVMKIIRHRVNRVKELDLLPLHWGAEMDLRSRGSRLVVQHDPFLEGDSFSDYVERWAMRGGFEPLIINPKEDGLETEALTLLYRHNIKNFFFVDLPPPATVRLAVTHQLPHVAVRVSEYEGIESAERFRNMVNWVWVDCFTGEAPSLDMVQRLRASFRVCLVSPELHRFPKEQIQRFATLKTSVDAVCTKHPELWS